MANFLLKLLGDPNKKEVNRYQDFVTKVTAFEPELEQLSDEVLRQHAQKLKTEISQAATVVIEQTATIEEEREQADQRRKAINDLLESKKAYAFALVREAGKRALGLRHYDVQLIGGAVLHQGQIAEMQTGEGKTLVASLPLFLNALTGLGVHLVTVNDYLARRDAGWMGPLYDKLGLTVGVVGPEFSYIFDSKFISDETDSRLTHLRPVERREAYQADITYGTNNEFGFDYLRDNMTQDPRQMVQRPLAYAIVDEVDSILIDEARTPLIISAPSSESAELYQQFATVIPKLKKEVDFTVDEKARSASLTDAGIKKLEQLLGVVNLYDPTHVRLVHHVDEALKAQALYRKNKDYVVKDGEVVIVDEFTGRMLAGRRYSGGLHQAIEAKEGVAVREESVTLATITFQNYFRLYFKLAGMTGTATTEAEEFSKIYGLEVVSIPTNRPSSRTDRQDVIYKNETAKFAAVTALVKELQAEGQPVLIGTVSIQKSEQLSRSLKAAGINHTVLNAKLHQKEGEIVAQAGRPGAVTVATNMAGRGVDIVLGGPAPDENATKETIKAWEAAHAKVLELGGLFVVGTERHESRRIDNQLRGRSGRQGDVGVTQFFISMEDDLMRIFGGGRMKSIMERLNIPDDVSINNSLLSRAIEQAQSRVESHNFDIRKQLVEYDDVMNKHRSAIYRRRQKILAIDTPELWQERRVELIGEVPAEVEEGYIKKAKAWKSDLQFQVEKSVALRAIDVLWVEHLKTMDDLRESIGLRGYAQREPIVEYKQEAYHFFISLQTAISQQIWEMLTHINVELNTPPPAPEPQKPVILQSSDQPQPSQKNSTQNGLAKVGRNDPCPCGAVDPQTGKVYKYKKCGLINASYHRG